MVRNIKYIGAVLSLLSLLCPFTVLAGTDAETTVKVGVLPYPPYSMAAEDGSITGAIVEQVRATFHEAGMETSFRILPYSRTMRLVEDGSMDAVYINAGTKGNFLFSKHHLGAGTVTFFTRKDEDWTYNGLPSLDGKRVLYVNGYSYSAISPSFQKYVEEAPNIVTISSRKDYMKNVLTMLINNRFDIFGEETAVMNYALSQYGMTEKVKAAGSLSGAANFHLGFSPNERGESLKEAFDKSYAKLLATGKIEEILAQFGVVRE